MTATQELPDCLFLSELRRSCVNFSNKRMLSPRTDSARSPTSSSPPLPLHTQHTHTLWLSHFPASSFLKILLASLHRACLRRGCEPEPGRGHFTGSKPCWRLQWIPAIPQLRLLRHNKRRFCRKRAGERLKCATEWLVVGPSRFFFRQHDLCEPARRL